MDLKILMDSWPLLETLGSKSKVGEKALRQMIDKDVLSYSWKEGRDIVADVLTKQGSRREILDEIMVESKFRNILDEKIVSSTEMKK